ncbi:MAG: hypothetical protein JSV44_03855, partial [Candidatus Zixiibacteriota bacterium]
NPINDSTAKAGKHQSYYADQPLPAIKTQHPTIALFKSMLVPGWGQIGNGKYVKAGIIIALEATLIGTYLHYRNKTDDAESDFLSAPESDRPWRFEEYEDARDQRNRFGWYTATLIFLSMFDAYVDAHLARFPERKDNISIDISPQVDEYVWLKVEYCF